MSYILFDAHNFYVSAELVWRPDLAGYPVVVIGSNDSCVISRSQQAKDIGISMGEPAHIVRDAFWRHNVKIFSANFALYGDMSSRMMQIIKSLTPLSLPYSIDESFSHCEGMSSIQIDTLAKQVRNTVKQWTGLPIGAGIGPTMTLAKVASYVSKRVLRIDQYAIHSDADRIKALAITPISAVWGVGPAFASKLGLAGVATALEFADLSPTFVSKNFPVGVRRTHIEVNGQNAVDIGDMNDPRQTINVGRSFGANISSFEDLSPAFAEFASKASEKLYRQRSVSGAITTSLFPTNRSQALPRAITARFQYRTNDPRAITAAAVDCLSRIFSKDTHYSKGGICLLDIGQPDSNQQAEMFDTHDLQGEKVASLISQVNARFGRGSLSVGRCLGSKRWMPRRDMLSDSFTTQTSQMLVVY
jgi:DNA polymerase V